MSKLDDRKPKHDESAADMRPTPLTIAGGARLEPPRAVNSMPDQRRSLISPVVVTGFVRIAEFLVIVALGLLIKHLYVGALSVQSDLHYLVAAVVAGLSATTAWQLLGLYHVNAFHAAWRQASRIWLGWTIVFASLAAAAFFIKIGPEYSRVWFASWYLVGALVLLFGRFGLLALTRRWAREGRLNRRVAIVGGGPEGLSLLRALSEGRNDDIRICGVFDDRGPERIGAMVGGLPILGRLVDLVEFSRKTRIDLLIIALPTTAEARISEIINDLLVLPVNVRLAAHASKLRFSPRAYSWIAGVPMLDIADNPMADWRRVQKWLFDKSVGLCCMALSLPAMAAISLAIRLDSRGPVFFRQKRYGFNNELIEVWKFRSLYVDKADAGAAKLVTKDDPRVTRVGRFIRKTSLDELPQLFNVLKGDLSLVGPRPHAVQAKAGDRLYPDAVDNYFARHKMKPGVTGWAQINGWRGETDTIEKIQKRVEYDIYYIENWSVLLDLYILACTPFALFKTESAY